MLSIYMLGHFRVLRDEQPIELNVRPKVMPLWAALLLRREQPTPRDTLASLLWPDETDSTALANLRRHLHELEHALPLTEDTSPWLIRHSSGIQWNPNASYWLDVAEFERLSALPDHLEKAAGLYTDELLVNFYDDWLLPDRSRLRSLYFDVVREIIGDVAERRPWKPDY